MSAQWYTLYTMGGDSSEERMVSVSLSEWEWFGYFCASVGETMALNDRTRIQLSNNKSRNTSKPFTAEPQENIAV